MSRVRIPPPRPLTTCRPTCARSGDRGAICGRRAVRLLTARKLPIRLRLLNLVSIIASLFFLAISPSSSAVSASSGKSKVAVSKATQGKSAAGRSRSVKPKSRGPRVSKDRAASSKAGNGVVRNSLRTEADLQSEVARVRSMLAKNPKDRNAKERLVDVAVAAVDMALAAEAIGNVNKRDRVVNFIKKNLSDIASRTKARAQNSQSGAMQALGYFYGSGIFFAADSERACAEFTAAAEHHAASAWHAAQCILDKRKNDAWVQIERAGGMGHAIAQEWLGRRCLGEFGAETKDFACARDWLGRSASQGRPKSQTLLAYLFNSGQGGAVDAARALRLYKLAAEQGDADAQNNLGEIYETGRGVDKSLPEAMQWYERAAERGLGTAQFNAGRLWAIGAGEKSDPARARAWLVQAEAKGVTQARQVLEWLDNDAVSVAKAGAKDAVPDESKSKESR
jgi:TPR repeat protein